MKDTMPLSEMPTYRGRREAPIDFDRFWQQQLADLPKSFGYTLAEKNFGTGDIGCYNLKFDGTNNGKVYARCVFPKNSKNFPVIFRFHGYMGQVPDWSALFSYVAMGYGVVAMDVRGQSGQSIDHGPFNGNTVKGHIVRGMIDGPDSLFYKDIYLDVYTLIEIVAGLPQTDENRFYSYGESQGGALSLIAAALNSRIKRCVTIYPFLSDFKRVLELGNTSEAYDELFRYFKFHDPFHESEEKILSTLDYIDIKNFAHLIKCPVKFVTCLDDVVCYPSTQYAIYNRIDAKKEHFLLPEYGHDSINVHLNDYVMNWLMDTNIKVSY